MIRQKKVFAAKLDKQNKSTKARGMMKLHVPIHERDQEAGEIGLLLLDEYKFPHAVLFLSENDLTHDGLKHSYNKIASFLKLKDKPDAGVTLIITPTFMFVGLIQNPYHIEPEIENTDLESIEEYVRHELTLFLDGFAYAGFVNL